MDGAVHVLTLGRVASRLAPAKPRNDGVAMTESPRRSGGRRCPAVVPREGRVRRSGDGRPGEQESAVSTVMR